jgi:hypothetical protein
MKKVAKTSAKDILDRFLDPLSESLTPVMARRIADFRADAETLARATELADKCTEGELTAAERREYQGFVRAIHLISILQSKARLALAKHRKSK